MNKKGIFIAMYAMLFIFVVFYAIFTMASSSNNLNLSKSIGYLQKDVYNTYNNADNYELYLNLKSDYAVDKSILEFTNIAWFYQNELDVTKFNIDLKSNFISIFKEKLAEPDLSIDIIDNKILIKSKKSYNLKHNNYNINYNQNVSATKDLTFQLDKFILLKEEIADKISCLNQAKDSIEANFCINNQGLNLKI